MSRNERTPTTLDGIGRDRVLSIVRHAYVLTMTQCTIELAWELAPDDLWISQRFDEFLSVDNDDAAVVSED